MTVALAQVADGRTAPERYSTLEEQARPILFMVSDVANYITATVLDVRIGDCG